jgi:gentisate 1,2-dioxygenase
MTDAEEGKLRTGSPFVDASGEQDKMVPFWRAFKVSREDIDGEIDRLKSLPKPANGRRRSYIVHPQSRRNSITPGIRASIEVLMPGEVLELAPNNSSHVAICIGGEGRAIIDDQRFEMTKHDTLSVPNMATQAYAATGDTAYVRLTFSDAPLLEHLSALYVADSTASAVATDGGEHVGHHRDPMADFIYPMPTGGGALKTYHAFIDPEVVEQSPHLWKWEEVKAFLNNMDKNTKDLRAAIIAMYWNPATGRTHGSTNTITAWMSGGVDPNWTGKKWDMARSHRHNVTAMNYAIAGNWKTIVEREEISWGPGDLVLTAPSWAAHSNGRFDREAYTFAIQDNALLAAMNSTILQEYVNRPVIHLGARPGFEA